jgi:chemotaxis signal transduction protein
MTELEETESRLLSFEVGGSVFALPIVEVLEVSEVTPIVSIPTLGRTRGGVMNHRGDAIPVLSLRVLLESDWNFDDSAADEPGLGGKHLLVLARDDDRSPKLGVPVDRVRGLISVPAESRKCEGIVLERFILDEREIVVIDSRQLMARATSVIEGGGTRVHPSTGG